MMGQLSLYVNNCCCSCIFLIYISNSLCLYSSIVWLIGCWDDDINLKLEATDRLTHASSILITMGDDRFLLLFNCTTKFTSKHDESIEIDHIFIFINEFPALVICDKVCIDDDAASCCKHNAAIISTFFKDVKLLHPSFSRDCVYVQTLLLNPSYSPSSYITPSSIRYTVEGRKIRFLTRFKNRIDDNSMVFWYEA